MRFEKVLETRRSVHSFEDRGVEKEKIRKAVESARRAPSAWNIQPWKIAVLETDESIKEAVETSYSQEWMFEADKIAVICGDKSFAGIDEAFEDMEKKGYKEEFKDEKEFVESFREKDKEWIELELTSNCMFLASAFMHSLWNQGVGSCPVKGFDQEELGDKLFEDNWLPILLIPIGYSNESNERKYRKEIDEILEFR